MFGVEIVRTGSMFGPEYPKINSLWKRDIKGKILVPYEYSQPEFDYLADNPWRWTEKIDGTNIRLHWDGHGVTIGGRTDAAQVPAKLITALKPYTDPAAWSKVFGDENDVTVYGEGYGAGIQKGGGLSRPDQDFIMFDVRVDDWWLSDKNALDVADKLGMAVVPEIPSRYTPLQVWDIILEAGAGEEDGYYSLVSRWEGVKIEGVVGRPEVPLHTRSGQRIITKLKLKDTQDL